jgi:hypothetical protein
MERNYSLLELGLSMYKKRNTHVIKKASQMIKKTLTLNVLSVMITKLKIGYLLKTIQIKVNAKIARDKDLTPKSSALAVKKIISFS